MQGLVTIDFGNSHPHVGFFQKHANEWKLIKVCPFSEMSLYLSQLEMNPNNTSMVLSEVKSREEELETFKLQGFLITRIKDYWRGNKFAGMSVNYTKTLGEDRLIQAFYLYKKLKKNVLLLDAGTFLTMDVVTTSGFEGGYIIPSLKNYQSTFSLGEQLKEVELGNSVSSKLPQATQEAMRDSYFAFAALAQKLISEHQVQNVVLTGGQAEFWKQIFDDLAVTAIVEVDPSLIHLALHYWMTTQIEPL